MEMFNQTRKKWVLLAQWQIALASISLERYHPQQWMNYIISLRYTFNSSTVQWKEATCKWTSSKLYKPKPQNCNWQWRNCNTPCALALSEKNMHHSEWLHEIGNSCMSVLPNTHAWEQQEWNRRKNGRRTWEERSEYGKKLNRQKRKKKNPYSRPTARGQPSL